jgi:ATP-binding cassette, subfamily B, bacterial
VHAINNLISWNIPYLLSLSIKLVGTAVYMVALNATLGVGVMVGFVAIKCLILSPIEKREKQMHTIEEKLRIFNSQMISEALDMISSIKLFSKEEQTYAEYSKMQERGMATLAVVVNLRCIREFLYGMARMGVFGGVLYFGVIVPQQATESDTGAGSDDVQLTTAAQLTAFFLVFQEFQTLFGRIKWHWELLVREFSDIDRFIGLMQVKPQMHSGATVLATAEGSIEFNDVHFEYPSRPGEEALKGLNLMIQPKKMTAIVGGSGAGKSTITKLLMRLYDPTKGTVTVAQTHWHC